jgi:hypothetical protein
VSEDGEYISQQKVPIFRIERTVNKDRLLMPAKAGPSLRLGLAAGTILLLERQRVIFQFVTASLPFRF